MLRRFLHRFRRDQRGVSMLEFSFIAPVMILMYFGIAELGQGLLAGRRVEHVAASIGDLTAQAQSVTNSDVSDIFQAGAQVMSPLPSTSLSMRLTSVTLNATLVPKVDWSDAYGGFTANTKGATYTLPAGLVTVANQSVIVAEATYSYTSPVKYVLPNGMSFSNKTYFSPRNGSVTRN